MTINFINKKKNFFYILTEIPLSGSELKVTWKSLIWWGFEKAELFCVNRTTDSIVRAI